MTKGQAKREVARLQKAFELCQWDIQLRCVDAVAVDADGGDGLISWDSETLVVFIDIAIQSPDEDVRSTILHEMIHLALVDMTEAHNKVLGLMSLEAAELGKATLEQVNEQTTVRLTRAFTNLCAK